MANEVAVNVLATIGTVLWCIQLIPQVIRNFRAKNCEGLPPIMMFLWAASGIPWSIYFIGIDASIPLMIQPQIFTFFCLVSWSQTLYYPPHKIARKKLVFLIGAFVIIGVGLEVGLILGLRPLHRRGITWPMLIIGILASVFLVVGLVPPYFELARRKGRVVGINFIFLFMDSAGALFSMVSVIIGNMDIMSIVLYVLVMIMEIGIILSHLIWWLRIGRKSKEEPDTSDCSVTLEKSQEGEDKDVDIIKTQDV